jgi:hypothetical protein
MRACSLGIATSDHTCAVRFEVPSLMALCSRLLRMTSVVFYGDLEDEFAAYEPEPCFFCNELVDDRRFGCALDLRRMWSPSVQRFFCHIQCLRKTQHQMIDPRV